MSKKAAEPTEADPKEAPGTEASSRLPLRGWALELARRWNGGTYSLFVLHGNIFDVLPEQSDGKVTCGPLKRFVMRRFVPERGSLVCYGIGDGLTFGSPEMQKRFFEWLEVFDEVENTNYHQQGPPREFTKLAPLLRRFFLRTADDKKDRKGVTLIIDFPEKVIPASEEAGASWDERMALVTLLKWAASPEMRQLDVGIVLATESAAELHADLLQNPHVAQVRIDLPDAEDRLRFLQSGWAEETAEGKAVTEWSDLTVADLATRTAGLNLLRVQHLLAEAVRNGARVTPENVASSKKRLIEEFCQGLVRFKDPKPGVTLDAVAIHQAAKKKLRELAWLMKNAKTDVLERGILVPGRVGVGKTDRRDTFA